MATITGGQAFPRPASIDPTQGTLPDGDRVVDGQAGMSLRDYFAGQALAGHGFDAYDLDGTDYPNLAERCYVLADAMIEARSK